MISFKFLSMKIEISKYDRIREKWTNAIFNKRVIDFRPTARKAFTSSPIIVVASWCHRGALTDGRSKFALGVIRAGVIWAGVDLGPV